jgi:hypothetical protein
VKAAEFAAKTALFGVGGWVLENMFFGPRFSAMWGGWKIPFLPVYALGGASIMLAAPHLQKVPWYARVPIYGGILTGVEALGCFVDRKLLGACSWDYSKTNCMSDDRGCIDFKHAIIWGVLGLAGEALSFGFRKLSDSSARGAFSRRGASHAQIAGYSFRSRLRARSQASHPRRDRSRLGLPLRLTTARP